MSKKMRSDFLILGSGIIGLSIALELKNRFPDCSVTVLDKEKKCGVHGSGRNSGVLHAGFYYTADSLKARFCRDGNKALTEYCLDNDLAINQCGKLVVAKNELELHGLNELYQRGVENDVDLRIVDQKQAREIEPLVKTFHKAIYSPSTSTIDPDQVISSLFRDARDKGVKFKFSTCYLSNDNGVIRTNHGDFHAGYVVNAAGLYADTIAHDYGFALDLRILPFKGLYLYANVNACNLKTHVYPVPNLNHPFLGVHFTISVDGMIKIGPTAIPALWRENYHGFSKFKFQEMLEILSTELSLFFKSDFDFRKLAIKECQKYFRPHLVGLASQLLEGVQLQDYRTWGAPGIRAQLYDSKQRKLVMDFCVEGNEKTFHVLNAVSPAFTASIPFAKYCCNKIEQFM
ncbi:L-2-hydroxyglutarate oxidase [Sulfurovum sp.]|uniref:L-2-hydroxyglutarate oxidase n=1 Tax=Sulfurovum sp. TaxID=1969726 RepID=UPI003565C862